MSKLNILSYSLVVLFTFGIIANAAEENEHPVKPKARTSKPIRQANMALSEPSTSKVAVGLSNLDCMIEPYQVVDVATAASGIIGEIRVDRGDIVTQGEVLANLDSGVEKMNVSLSHARAKFSKRKFNRMQEVFNKKGISDHAKDEAEVEKRLANLEYRRSLEVLKMRTIKSPLSGVVVERFAAPGEYTEQEKILKIAQIDPLNVEIIAPVSMFGKAKPGMKVLVIPEQPVGGKYKAMVKVIDKVIDPASGTFGIRLELSNKEHKIPSGIKCRAQFD